jgi:hypothetical protein
VATAEKKKILGLCTIKRVRLSYPFIYEPDEASENDDGELGKPKYRAAFLLPKSGPDSLTTATNLKVLRAAKEEVMQAKWKDDQPTLRPDRICVQDGKFHKDPVYKQSWYLNASDTDAPELLLRVKDKDGVWKASTTPNEIYGGCWVNAIVLLWAMDHKKYGQRINANLKSIQFHEDGESFGSKVKIDRKTAFDDVEEIEYGSIGDDDDEDDLVGLI